MQRLISVDGDGAQIEDGGSAAQNVGRQPHLAHHVRQGPITQDLNIQKILFHI